MKTFLSVMAIVMLAALFSPLQAKDPVPEWARGAVWYQILPERFRNINAYNDPVKDRLFHKRQEDWQIHPWASDWNKLQVWEEGRDKTFAELLAERRYGGDLIGVFEKLPYLKALGVDVIYLTPIFEAPSIKKYDASTLHHIDNNFGVDRDKDWQEIATGGDDPEQWQLTKADELWSDLLREIHLAKLRVVLEVVFNYCGSEFWAFQDLKKKQQRSKYKDWFQVASWDDPATPDTVEFVYACWQGDKNLPLFRTDELGTPVPEVKEYFFNITRRWMNVDGEGPTTDGVDGWSARHVDALSATFWREWNELVRSLNNDAVTISDFAASDAKKSDRYNFSLSKTDEFSDLIIDFFVTKKSNLTISDFVAALNTARANKRRESRSAEIIQLSRLDGPRISGLIAQQRKQTNGANGNGEYANYPVGPDSIYRKIQQLVTVFQLTCDGSPMIYYGDETGMWGGDSPHNIKPMLWKEFVYERESYRSVRPDLQGTRDNRFDDELFNIYRRLNELRSKNLALRLGEFHDQFIDNERGILVYSRRSKTNEVWVFMNFSDKMQHVEINPGWKKNLKLLDPFSAKKYRLDKFDLKLDLAPISYRVLVKKK